MPSRVVWTKVKKSEVEAVLAFWLEKLQMDRWDISWAFSENSKFGFSAESIRRTPYRQGELTFYPRILKKSPKELDTCIIHELVHLILWPLSEWHGDENENVFIEYNEEITDWIAQTIYSVSEG